MAVNQTWDADGNLVSSTPVADPVPAEQPSLAQFTPREFVEAAAAELQVQGAFTAAKATSFVAGMRNRLKR